ncbi:MAG: patatin-like phospholipase family protein [Candidatus Udaeobacter sp.]
MSEKTSPPKQPRRPHDDANFFWHLEDIYHKLKPCRFVFIVAIIGAIVFLVVEQGREVLRALAEPGVRTGVTSALRLSMFGVGLLIWSLASWYSARVLLYFDFPTRQEVHPTRTGIWQRLHEWLPANVPRILGVAPVIIVGWSFLYVRGSYESDPPSGLLYLGLVALGGGVALYVFFVLRRRWIEQRDHRGAGHKYQRLGELPRGSSIVLTLMTIFSLALCTMFIINPVYFAGAVGTGAVLTFAAACWVFWGSALVYFGSWKRIPVIMLIVLLVLIASLFNDNHDVRVLAREPFSRPTLRQALLDWNSQITKKYPERPVHPLFIVATEGGGIRAAYWTATVLGTIQDADPSFANHVFAISGVSGGSLGAAVFDALVADGTLQGEFAKRGQSVLGQDFLSPAAAAMLYPDLIQRFLPFPILFLDRGQWLERGWENAWRNTTHTNRFARPFLDLWEDRDRYVPSLFLNATSVENGNRIIASNILIDGNFIEATDATTKLLPISQHTERRRPKIDVPLSTAAHMSARFTYVSPAGRFDPDGTHVVDGGYFENSGAATALDILRQVNDELHQDPELRAIIPQIIMISNNPLGVASGSRNLTMTKQALKNIARTAAAEAAQRKPGTFLEDALAPAYALLSTRDARGDYAQKAIGQAQREFCSAIKAQPGIEADEPQCLYFFSLAPATVPLPLGWMLSDRAAEAMQKEMFDSGLSTKAPVPTWNQSVLKQIVAALHGETH